MMLNSKRQIAIHFESKGQKSRRLKVKVTADICQHFGSETIVWSWIVSKVQISYFIQRCRILRGRNLCILGSNVRSQRSRSQLNNVNTGSDTITLVVFNVQLTYFKLRCRMVRGRYIYILGSKGQIQRPQLNLSTLWFLYDGWSNFERTPFIFHTQIQDGKRKIHINFGFKGQDHNWTLSSPWFWHDNLSIFQHSFHI